MMRIVTIVSVISLAAFLAPARAEELMVVQAPDGEEMVVIPAEDLEQLDDEDMDFMTLAKKAKKKKAAPAPAPAPAPKKKAAKKKKFFLAEEISTDAISPFAALLISFCVGSALTLAVFQIRRRTASKTAYVALD